VRDREDIRARPLPGYPATRFRARGGERVYPRARGKNAEEVTAASTVPPPPPPPARVAHAGLPY